MSQLFPLPTALCLPVPDIEALIQGRTVAALPRMFLRPGQKFALYPINVSADQLSIEKYYRPNFLSNAQTAIKQVNSETVSIKAWAKCELCQILDKTKPLDILSQLTIWTTEAFEAIIQKQQNIFFAYLRVYHLPQFQDITVNANIQDKLGKFVGLPNIVASEAKPILDAQIFAQRKSQLEKLEPSLNTELEELQSALSQISNINPAARQLENDIKIFLGWSSEETSNILDSDIAWIKTIAEIGNSSDGYTFEKLVRRGLLKLGFTGSGLNPEATGGAGGMDFYSETPYPIVGECKATKSEKVPDGTPTQLLRIGITRLGKIQYEKAVKLIVAAGKLTSFALRTATEHQMNVISPETLQKLVELQTQYKNSVNLLELKQCLQQVPFGLADDKVNSYIAKVEQDIKLRSHIIQLVKNYLQNSGIESAGVDTLHGAYFGSKPPQPLKPDEMHEILIELSSPLTGYLGREKGKDWKNDKFYYLRDLSTN